MQSMARASGIGNLPSPLRIGRAALSALFFLLGAQAFAAGPDDALRAEREANLRKIAAITAQGDPIDREIRAELDRSASIVDAIKKHNARRGSLRTEAERKAFNATGKRLTAQLAPYKKRIDALVPRLEKLNAERERLLARNAAIDRQLQAGQAGSR